MTNRVGRNRAAQVWQPIAIRAEVSLRAIVIELEFLHRDVVSVRLRD